ncbi:MAG: hypothetical protein JSS66_05865 [Armatimonadetes bacterium]|nr:hypothetical protein [Armatimonadota bacterium]
MAKSLKPIKAGDPILVVETRHPRTVESYKHGESRHAMYSYMMFGPFGPPPRQDEPQWLEVSRCRMTDDIKSLILATITNKDWYPREIPVNSHDLVPFAAAMAECSFYKTPTQFDAAEQTVLDSLSIKDSDLKRYLALLFKYVSRKSEDGLIWVSAPEDPVELLKILEASDKMDDYLRVRVTLATEKEAKDINQRELKNKDDKKPKKPVAVG